MIRYYVDGLTDDHPDSDFAGDGEFPPFVVFDVDEQRNLPKKYLTREAAQTAADRLNSPPMSLTEALDLFSVMPAEDVAPGPDLTGWSAVVDEDGINAYFSTETAAFRHRLDLINRRLNG